MAVRGETKVHYKMFKSGKKWVVAGIAVVAMVPIMFGPTVLAPMAPVRAATTSVDKSGAGLAQHYFGNASWDWDNIKKDVAEGAFVDNTTGGYSSVNIPSPQYVDAIAGAGMKLLVKDNQWYVLPRDNSKNVDLNSVLAGVGFPTDAQLAAPTDANNQSAILKYLQSAPLNDMNGGKSMSNSDFPWAVISGGGFTLQGNEQFTNPAIAGGYSVINAGMLDLTGNNSAPGGKELITDGGSLTGTGSLPDAISSSINNYVFTTDSLAGKERSLRSASDAIVNGMIAGAPTTAASWANNNVNLDFKNAQSHNGTYVFTVDSDQLASHKSDFAFQNGNLYDGHSNIVINITGSATMAVPNLNSVPGGAHVYIASTSGTPLDFTNADLKNDNTTLITPHSNVTLSGGSNIGGFVGAINGDGNADGYDGHTGKPDTGTDTTQPVTNNYNVQFVDVNNNNKVVGTSTVSGKSGDKDNVTLPDKWALAKGASNTVTLTDDPTKPIQVPVIAIKTATVTQTITSQGERSTTDSTPVTDNDKDSNGNPIKYTGKVSDLPGTVTRPVTVTYTSEGTGDQQTINVLSGITGNTVFTPIQAQNIAGWIEDTNSVANTFLDENALISKLKTLDSDNGQVSVNAQLIYYPSSTSVHKTLTFTSHVIFDYDDDSYNYGDPDPSLLPKDFDRTATVGYTETTNYDGTKTMSDFAVEGDDGLTPVTNGQIGEWNIPGYTNSSPEDANQNGLDSSDFIDNAGMIALLQSSDGSTISSTTEIDYDYTGIQGSVDFVDVDEGNKIITGPGIFWDNQTSSYEVSVPNGYQLAPGQSDKFNMNDVLRANRRGHNYQFKLAHSHTVQTVTTTRTIHFEVAAGGDQSQTPKDITQTATWSYSTDDVTGVVSDATVTKGGYTQVNLPSITGYTDDHNGVVAGETLAATTADQIGNANQTVTVVYTAAKASLQVTYHDDVTGDTISGLGTTLSGLDGTDGSYTVQVPTGYALASGQSGVVKYTFATGDRDNFVVHLTHVFDNSQVTTTRTINYVVDGNAKAPKSVTQSVTWNVSTDEVSHVVVATPQDSYAGVTSPAIAGYTADHNVTPDTLTQMNTTPTNATAVTVTYTADKETLTVHYIDDVTGDQVSTDTVSGVMDGTGTYTVSVPAKYVLAKNQGTALNYTLTNDDSDDLTVHVTHAVDHTNATTTRTITYVVNGDKSKTPASVTQTIDWTVATDEVTNTSVATPANGYAALNSPAIAGYTVSGNAPAVNVGTADTKTPANGTNVTITYTANAETLTVHYVDDVTGAPVSTDTVTGQMDEQGNYAVKTPATYTLAKGQSGTVAYTLTNDGSDDITVHLTHAIDHTTVTTTRTINYTINGQSGNAKAPKRVTQSITWNVSTDEVTKTHVATPQGSYDAVQSPAINGYTATGDVPAGVLDATTDTPVAHETATINYTADNVSLTVHYVDDITGKQVTSVNVGGVMDERGNYQVQAPATYTLATGQATSIAYTLTNDNSDDITVHLTHIVDHTTATTTRTITYVVNGDKSKTPKSVVQTIDWTVATDEVTKTSVATPANGYAAVESPAIAGYTVNGNAPAVNVGTLNTATPTNGDPVTITYTANDASLTVHYVDDVDGTQVSSTTVPGKMDDKGNYVVQVPAKYALANGQADTVAYTITNDNSDDITVHLTHAIDHTTTTTTRTINYTINGQSGNAKAPKSVTQSVTWNVSTDEVTKTHVATPQGSYAAVKSPAVGGYVATGDVPAGVLNASTDTPANAEAVTVNYAADNVNLTVHYIDDVTGNEVTSVNVGGKMDEQGNYQVQAPTKYVLADGQATNVAYTLTNDNSDDITVHLTHAIDHTTTTTTRTINYVVNGDKSKTPASVVQTMNWNVETDEATGKFVATPAGVYAAVESPAIAGYTVGGNAPMANVGAVDTATPTNGGVVTITYTANDASLTVHYVDDVDGTQVSSTTVPGKMDGKGTYTVQVPKGGYVLADGQSDNVAYTFTNDNSDDITVHLTHAVNHTTVTTTRTINYTINGQSGNAKAPKSVTQSVTWNVSTDEVNGNHVATPQGSYNAVQSPTIDGYTATGDVPAGVLDATTGALAGGDTVTINYTADNENLTVHYIDDVTGEQVSSFNVSGKMDEQGNFQVQTPAKYVLANGQATSVAYTLTNNDKDDITVHLTHAIDHTTATTTRTINYVVNGDKSKTPASVVQTMNWKVETDEVTGETVATPANVYAAVTSPAITGYTVSGNAPMANVGAVNTTKTALTNGDAVTITYTANDANLTVHYVDDTDGTQVSSTTLSGKMDGKGTYTVQVSKPGYILADGQSDNVAYTYTNDNSDDITVHLTHAIDHTTTTTTRTINYVVNGDKSKTPASVVQTMNWKVETDEVTGKSVATPANVYAAVESPAIAGYTVSGNAPMANVGATNTATPADGGTVIINYTANDEGLTVHYVDDVTGDLVTSSTATLSGKMDGKGTYVVQVPAKYVLADGQAGNVAYTFTNDNSDDITVHLTHAFADSQITTERTINYTINGQSDNAKTPASVTQTLTWNVSTDEVTGNSTATPDGSYATVASPTVAGYTASGDAPASVAVTTATPTNGTTVTINYTANDEGLTVRYVDDVTGDQVNGSTTLSGKMDGTGTYLVQVPDKYALAKGQSDNVAYTYTNDNSDDITIHLTHAINHTTVTTTRTINYVVNGDKSKTPASVVQTMNWNVATDEVTGESYATAQNAYAAVPAPTVNGYHADHGTDAQVLAPVATSELGNTTTTVTYAPNAANLTVTYVDDTDGSTVTTATVSGLMDGTGTYSVSVPARYQLANGQNTQLNYKFTNDDGDNLTVHLVHHMTAGTATTTRTVNYVVDGKGTAAPASVTQTAVFTTTTDDVTGAMTATPDGSYAAVTTPALAGYTASGNVSTATPSFDNGNTSVTVSYAPNAEQLNVRYVDDVTGATINTDTVSGVMNGRGVYLVTVPANYALANGQSRAVSYRLTNDDSDNLTVHLTHVMQYGTTTTTRTINYVVRGGQTQAPATVVQTVNWRTVTDLVTGASVATATNGYAAVTSPSLAGYTVSGNVPASQLGATNANALGNSTITVTYTAIPQPNNGGTTTPTNGGTTTPTNGGNTTPTGGGTNTPATTPTTPANGGTPVVPAQTPAPNGNPTAPATTIGQQQTANGGGNTAANTPINAASAADSLVDDASSVTREASADAAANRVAQDEKAATQDVNSSLGAQVTDALAANGVDAVAQRAVTPGASVTTNIINRGEQSQNRIPGGSAQSTYTYFAQKIANSTTQQAVQYELLLRQWDSGINNWVLPSSFGITVGMQTTLMDQALRGLDSSHISINLTTSQFTDQNVVKRLSSFAKAQTGSLTIELAELPTATQLEQVMPAYHDGGIKVVLGDAQDADISTVSHVASQLDGFKFALQKLRARGQGDTWIVAAHQWQALARDTHGSFTLEGVETSQDLQAAQEMGISNVQGYLFGKPSQPTEINFD